MNTENENLIEETSPQNQGRKKLPTFLTVLIVLSGITIGSGLLSHVQELFRGPLSETEMEEVLAPIYDAVSQFRENDIPEEAIEIAEVMIANKEYVNEYSFHLANTLGIITFLVGAAGLFFMFKLKKIGFHLYIVYSLLPAITAFAITPVELIPTLTIVLSLAISAIMVLLYGMNLKHMD